MTPPPGEAPSQASLPPKGEHAPRRSSSPARDEGVPFDTYQVRVEYGGEELVITALIKPGETAQDAAAQILSELRFVVERIDHGVHYVGALSGVDAAARLMARAVITLEQQRREGKP